MTSTVLKSPKQSLKEQVEAYARAEADLRANDTEKNEQAAAVAFSELFDSVTNLPEPHLLTLSLEADKRGDIQILVVPDNGMIDEVRQSMKGHAFQNLYVMAAGPEEVVSFKRGDTVSGLDE